MRSASSVGISQYLLKYRNIGETSIFFNSNRNFPNLNRKKWNNRQYIVLELFYRTTFFRNGSLSRKMKLFAVYRTHPTVDSTSQLYSVPYSRRVRSVNWKSSIFCDEPSDFSLFTIFEKTPFGKKVPAPYIDDCSIFFNSSLKSVESF